MIEEYRLLANESGQVEFSSQFLVEEYDAYSIHIITDSQIDVHKVSVVVPPTLNCILNWLQCIS